MPIHDTAHAWHRNSNALSIAEERILVSTTINCAYVVSHFFPQMAPSGIVACVYGLISMKMLQRIRLRYPFLLLNTTLAAGGLLMMALPRNVGVGLWLHLSSSEIDAKL